MLVMMLCCRFDQWISTNIDEWSLARNMSGKSRNRNSMMRHI